MYIAKIYKFIDLTNSRDKNQQTQGKYTRYKKTKSFINLYCLHVR